MDNEQKYAIYVAERPIEGFGETYHHAFLMLVNEDNGTHENAEVIQQLHFKDDNRGYMTAEMRHGISSAERMKELKLFPYIGGQDGDVLQMWNHALRMAEGVKRAGNVKFEKSSTSRYAMNCRAGVRTAINAMGMEYSDKNAMGVSGSHGSVTRLLDIFSFSNKVGQCLQEIVNENEVLAKSLKPPPEVEIIDNPSLEELAAFFE